MIPKRIYYVWLGKKSLPTEVQVNIESWKATNPDYSIIEINESNFNINKYTFVKEAYEQGQWAFASDVIRLDIIYNNGGFYFDTDVRLLKSIEPLRYKDSVWGLETVDNVNSGLIIGACKGNIDLKNLLSIYKKKHFKITDMQKLITTGIISEYFKSQGLKPKNSLQILPNGAYIYPSDYFAPKHWWGGGHITYRTIAIQEYRKEWGSKNKQVGLRRWIRLNFRHNLPKLFYFIQNIRHRRGENS